MLMLLFILRPGEVVKSTSTPCPTSVGGVLVTTVCDFESLVVQTEMSKTPHIGLTSPYDINQVKNKSKRGAKSAVTQNKSGQQNNNNKNNGMMKERSDRVRLNREPNINYSLSNNIVPDYRVRTGSTPGGVRICGSELYDGGVPIAVDPLQPSIYLWPITPLSMTRLQFIARTYEHFYFHHVRFDYVPAVPFTTQGITALGVDYDYDDGLPTSLAEVMTCQGARMGPIYSKVSTELLGRLSTYRRYYTKGSSVSNIDNVQKYQGGLKLWSTGSNVSTNAAGYIVISYDIEFFSPGQAGS